MIGFDAILEKIGGSGKYQYRQCMPLTLVLPLMSWHLLGNAFLFAIPEKRCNMDRIVPDSCSSQLSLPNGMGNYSLGENDDLLRYLFIVKTDDAKYGNCNYRKFPTFNASKFESVCSDLESFPEKKLYKKAENGTAYLDPQILDNLKSFTEKHGFDEKWVENNENFIQCDSWIYDETFGVTGLTENNWACPGSASQNLQIAVMVGVFWGSPLFGWTSDTYGRKPTIVACLSLCLASMALIRFASHSWIFLLALRMFDGAGAIGAIAAAFVLISEIFESVGYHKIMVLQVAQACFGLSQIGLAYLAKGLADWSPLSTYIAAPCLLVVFIQIFNDESPRWLINKSYIYEANELCKKIARVNGRQVEKSYLSENENLNEEDEVSEESFKLAMRKPKLRKTILNLCFQWFMLSGLYYTLAIKATEFDKNDPHKSFAISGLLEAPACFGTLLMYQFIGRRPSTFYMEVVGGLSLLFLIFVPAGSALANTLPQIGKFALSAAYGGIYIYSAEIFPTSIKNFGIGMCSAVARIAGVAAQLIEAIPTFCGVQSEDDLISCDKIPYFVYCVLTIIGCFLMFGLPETNGHESPNTIEEGEAFGQGQQSLIVQILSCNKSASLDKANSRSSNSIAKSNNNLQQELHPLTHSADESSPETDL